MSELFKFPEDVIDGHIHITNWQTGGEVGYDNYFENYIEDVKAYINRVNLKHLNVASIAGTNSTYDFDQNILCAILKLECEKVFVHGSLCHPIQPVRFPIAKDFDYVLQVKEMEELGFDGIKMLEGKPNSRKRLELPIDSPELDDYYSYLEEKGTHVIFHVNDPDEFWDRTKVSPFCVSKGWVYDTPGFLSYEEHYTETLNMLKKHPTLHVTFAHLFFMSKQPERLTELLDTYPNMCIDITPGGEMYVNMGKTPELWHNIFTKYQDRILFGTDCITGRPPESMNKRCEIVYKFLTTTEKNTFGEEEDFVGLGLDADIVHKIMYQNFVNKVSDKPKPINKAALVKYIEKYLPLTKNEHNRKMILDYANKNL